MAENEQNLSAENDDKTSEKEHFQRIINAFKYYRLQQWQRIGDAERHYTHLPERHKQLIPSFLTNLDNIRCCVDHNYEIIKLMLKTTEGMFQNSDVLEPGGQNNKEKDTVIMASEFDMDKVRTTLKQFVRDWSSDGAEERAACYQPIINDILEIFPCQDCDPREVRILVPGAGLGRLALEVARNGYSCQGNEWSLFMLFASNFILNRCHTVDGFTLYPYVHQWINNKRDSDQTKAIKFPDINPADLPYGVDFSMAAGDFMEVYTEEDDWDCIATVFFIDTAHNIVAYIERIYQILRPGGYWINLGPLLYHFADMPNESSIELSYEEVKSVIEKVGFIIEKEKTDVECTYTQNPSSMLRYVYKCVYFVARKPS